MADPKRLVLSATLDVRDVGAKARQATAEINALKRAATDGPGVRGGRKLPGLGASDAELDAFYGPAPKALEQSRKGADRFKLSFRQTTGEVKSLGAAIKQLPNLTEALGIYGLRGITNLIGSLPRLGSALGSIAKLVGAGGGLVGLAGLIGGGAIFRQRQAVALQNESTASLGDENSGVIKKLKEIIQKANAAGGIRGGRAEDLVDQINQLDARNSKNLRTKNDQVRSLSANNIAAELAALQRKFRESLVAGFEIEEAAAREHQQALLEIRKTGVESERAIIARKLERISTDQSLTEAKRAEMTRAQYAKLRNLATEETEAQNKEYERQEGLLEARLKREENDVEATAKTKAELQEIADKRTELFARANSTRADINAAENQSLRDNLARAPRQRQSSDALQRIGLFRGGAPERSVTIAQQQLSTLKRIEVATVQLPGRIKV